MVTKKLEEYEEVAGKLAEIDAERRDAVDEKHRLEDKLQEMRQRLANDGDSRREQTEEKLCLSEDEIHRLHKVRLEEERDELMGHVVDGI